MRELVIQKLRENKSLAKEISGLTTKTFDNWLDKAPDTILLYMYELVIRHLQMAKLGINVENSEVKE